MQRIRSLALVSAFCLAASSVTGTPFPGIAVADANPLSVESPVEFAEKVLSLYASGAGVMMPVEDEPYVEDRTPLIRTLVGFPQDFLDGLVPVRFVHYDTYPITVRLDDETGAAMFYNADDVAFYIVQPAEDLSDDWMLAYWPDAATNPFHAPSHVAIKWRVIPEGMPLGDPAPEASPPLRLMGSAPSSAAAPVTNLCFTGISTTPTNVTLDIAWPPETGLPEATLDLYFSTTLSYELPWEWLLPVYTDYNGSNVTVVLDGEMLPGFISEPDTHVHDATCIPVTNVFQSIFSPEEIVTSITYSCETNPPAPPVGGFFIAGTRDDSDGDGYPDAYEKLVSQTSSSNWDTDGDGIADCMDWNPLVDETEGTDWVLHGNVGVHCITPMATPVQDNPLMLPTNRTVRLDRLYAINRSGDWQRYFLSLDGASYDEPMLWNETLSWQDSEGVGGTIVVSNECQWISEPLDVSTNSPTWLSLHLESTNPGYSENSPLYLYVWTPKFAYSGLPSFASDGSVYYAYAGPGIPALSLSIGYDGLPYTQSSGEVRNRVLDRLFAMEGLAIRPAKGPVALESAYPGIHPLPGVDPIPAEPFVGFTNAFLHLAPTLTFGDGLHGAGNSLVYTNNALSRVKNYPLDTAFLRDSFYRDGSGGYVCDCGPRLSLGTGDPLPTGLATNIVVDGETATATIAFNGTVLWTGSATHVHDCEFEGDASRLLSGGDNPDACACGNGRETEGDRNGCLAFRIPLGFPRQNQISGFLWFLMETPEPLSPSAFRLLARGDASITDSTVGGVRVVTCSDERGWTVSLSQTNATVYAVVTDTASGELEHRWELARQDGGSYRLRKISRAENTMRDVTYSFADGAWRCANAIDQTVETHTVADDLAGSGVYREERTLSDAAGTILRHTVSESRSYGAYDAAVLRETLMLEASHSGLWKTNTASYWEDFEHPLRNGKPRLLAGSARPWQYTTYDTLGRPMLRLDQWNGSAVPETIDDGTEWTLVSLPAGTECTATTYDYLPLSGDTGAAEDADRPRILTRYLVRNGHATLIGRTWSVYTHDDTGALPTVTVRTERAGSQGASFGAAGNAVSTETHFDENAPGVPLLLRGRPFVETDEDGVSTHYVYDFGAFDASTRTFTPAAGGAFLRTLAYRTTSSAPCGVPYQATGTLTIEDATHGNLVYEANLVQVGTGDQRLGVGDFALLDWSCNTYDDQNRLRHTLYSDESWSTNAYSCCRLLWTQDREGRKVLRSAQTGTDHLYYATEDVYLLDIPRLGGQFFSKPVGVGIHSGTLHFMDPLGRETNMTWQIVNSVGSAVNPSVFTNENKRCSETVEFPDGVSGHRIRTQKRGVRTETWEYGSAESTVSSNATYSSVSALLPDTSVVTTTLRNGDTIREEHWGGEWTRAYSLRDFTATGCRVETDIRESSDYGMVTNSVSTYDFLGRLVLRTTPTSCESYVYEGVSQRLLRISDSVSGLSSENLYNDLGETIGTVSRGVTNLSITAYEQRNGAWWRINDEVVVGSVTNAHVRTSEQASGLSNACREHRIQEVLGGATTEVHSSCDASSGRITTTSTNSVSGWQIRRSLYGVEESVQTSHGTTMYFYDPFGRLYTETLRKPSQQSGGYTQVWYGRNRFGDIDENTTFYYNSAYHGNSYVHDAYGHVVETTNDLGKVRTASYDSRGRIVEEGGTEYPARYAYDTRGNRTGLSTTRDGQTWDTTQWTYDAQTGLCTEKTYADGTAIGYTHTADGLPVRTTYARGSWMECDYDNARRMTAKRFSDSALDCAFQYDEFDQIVGVSNQISALQYAHGHATITNETVLLNGETRTIRRDTDAFGRPIRLCVDNDEPLHFGYAPDGQLDVVSNAFFRAQYLYREYGPDAGYTLTLSNGVEVARGVSRMLRRPFAVLAVTNTVGNTVLSSIVYGYDGLCRIVSRNGQAIGYNDRSEVTRLQGEGFSDSYAYDEIGNRTSSRDSVDGGTWGYDANELNQYSAISSVSQPGCTPFYDLDGNLTNVLGRTYSYDAANRLVSVSDAQGLVVSNRYDALDRRVQKITPEYTATFLYDGWNVVEERMAYTNGTDHVFRYYWGKDLSESLQGAGGIGGLLCFTCDGDVYVPVYDQIGNIVAVVDSSGTEVASFVYDAFGRTVAESGSATSLVHYRFSTKYWDEETGMCYYGYRFYVPRMGRWLNRDPIGEKEGGQVYAFIQNHSVSDFDFLGLSPANSLDVEWNELRNLMGISTGIPNPADISILLPEIQPTPPFFTTISRKIPNVFSILPDCPCEIPLDCNGKPTNAQTSKGWTAAEATGHIGGTWEIRKWGKTLFPPVGQQCVYDSAGKLINVGSSVGTPDLVFPWFKYSPLWFLHALFDGVPWKIDAMVDGNEIAEQKDHLRHPPNRGKDCYGNPCPENDGTAHPPLLR